MRVLIVEDDAQLRDVLSRALEESGFSTAVAEDGLRAETLAAEGEYDAIILDWMLPGMSGLDVCRRLRDAGDTTPVVMLTARDEIEERISGLDAGADDYVVKPVDTGELQARLRAIIRRSARQRSAVYTAGPLKLDVSAREVSIGSRRIELSQREFDLLELLMRNANVALSRQAIEERVWGAQFASASNVVDVFIRRVRKRLGIAGEVIETVRGHGYRLTTRKETADRFNG